MCYSSISGRDSPHYLKMQRQQQRYGGYDLQKVKRKLRITLFPACIMHMFTPMQVRRMQAYNGRFVKAWNKQYVSLCVFMCEYVWNAFLVDILWISQLPPQDRQRKDAQGPFCSRKSHIMIQPSLPPRRQPICGLVAVWIRTVATPTLWDWKCVFWISSECDYRGLSSEGEFISCAPNVIIQTHFWKCEYL